MDFKEFSEKFAEAIEMEDASILTLETKFRELDDWSSLGALSVISMFEDDLDIELPVDAFKKAITLEDLFLLIK